MHGFQPGPFPHIFFAAVMALVLIALLLWKWAPRIKGWGQIGVLYLLLSVAALAVVVALGAGAAWWMFA